MRDGCRQRRGRKRRRRHRPRHPRRRHSPSPDGLQLLQTPEEEPDGKLRERLQRLKEWERGAEFPASFVPAMFLLDQRDRGRLTTDEVASALRLIESYLVRRTLVDTSNKSDLVLREVPGALAGATDVVAGLRQYLSGAKAPWPDDTEVRRAILNKPFYYHGKAHQRVFILRRLEESYDQPERVDWTRPVYSIEHVLPQGLTPEWTAALQPDATRFGVATRELHRLVVHTLGNLTLTGKNGPLSNRPFSDKRRILNESALVMNRRIAEREEWNSTEIERRGRELAERVFQIWPGPVDGAPSVVADEWTTLHRALALAPAGGWLPLASLASLLGKRPRELASYLVAEAPANWYRVLGAAGSVLEGNGANGASQRSLLEAEGVVFSADGLASPKQRVDVRRIAPQLGFDVGKSRTAGVTTRPVAHLRHKQRRRK